MNKFLQLKKSNCKKLLQMHPQLPGEKHQICRRAGEYHPG